MQFRSNVRKSRGSAFWHTVYRLAQ